MRKDDELYVTNGRGCMIRGTIRAVEEDSTTIAIDKVLSIPQQPEMTLAVGCLKKEAFEQTVRHCTEIGVTCFVPFRSTGSHVDGYKASFLRRLDRITLSAMKQSFRAMRPTVEPTITFDELLDRTARYRRVWVGDAESPAMTLDGTDKPSMIIVGPEPGLTADERERLRDCGCQLGSISSHRLRSETAALVLSALVLWPGTPPDA